MSQDFNPYASPAHVAEAKPVDAENRRLYAIAKAQRFLVQIVGLGMLTVVIFQFAGRSGVLAGFNPRLILGVVALVQLIVSVLQSIAMFRMGKTVHNMFQAVGLAIFSFIPCIGLILMLIVNSQATRQLQAGGIKVGFLGADLNQFDPAIRD